MIVTIDGPAGAGKTTVARVLAKRLGFEILDTGAMYRAVAWALIQRQIDPADGEAVWEIASRLKIRWENSRIWVDQQEVTQEIRDPQVTQIVSTVADHQRVRSRMVELQRSIVRNGNYVTDGRDQGTVAFPDAEVKIFLVASPEQRARRRWRELERGDPSWTLDDVRRDQDERDRRDRTRPVGALRRATDAVEICTDGKSIEQVVDELEAIVRAKGSVL